MQKAREGKEDPKHFSLVCKSCSEELVEAKDMVKYNHHHIVSEYEDKYRAKLRTVPIPPEKQRRFQTEEYLSK